GDPLTLRPARLDGDGRILADALRQLFANHGPESLDDSWVDPAGHIGRLGRLVRRWCRPRRSLERGLVFGSKPLAPGHRPAVGARLSRHGRPPAPTLGGVAAGMRSSPGSK